MSPMIESYINALVITHDSNGDFSLDQMFQAKILKLYDECMHKIEGKKTKLDQYLKILF